MTGGGSSGRDWEKGTLCARKRENDFAQTSERKDAKSAKSAKRKKDRLDCSVFN